MRSFFAQLRSLENRRTSLAPDDLARLVLGANLNVPFVPIKPHSVDFDDLLRAMGCDL